MDNDKFQRTGKILTLMELETLSHITPEDVRKAVGQWQKVAPKPFRELLSAVVVR